MAEGSRVVLRLRAAAVPVLEGARDLAARGVVPGGSKANLEWVLPHVRFSEAVDAAWQQVLADAQTNGGLLAAVDPERTPRVLALLREVGVEAAHVGEVAPAPRGPGLEVA
jgi:selenide,water dikinase